MSTANNLKNLFLRNHSVITRNLEGISHEESLQKAGEGNNVNWIIGHIVSSRNGILKSLGKEFIWDKETARPYIRGAETPDAHTNLLALDDIKAAYNSSQEQILAALDGISEEVLAAYGPNNMTVGGWVDFLGWHEGYHAGQLGLCRRLLGKKGAI